MYSTIEFAVLSNLSGRKQLNGKWYDFILSPDVRNGSFAIINQEWAIEGYGDWEIRRTEKGLQFNTVPAIFDEPVYISISFVPESLIDKVSPIEQKQL